MVLFHLSSVHESELPLSSSDPDFSGRANIRGANNSPSRNEQLRYDTFLVPPLEHTLLSAQRCGLTQRYSRAARVLLQQSHIVTALVFMQCKQKSS